MHGEVILALGIEDTHIAQRTRIAYLTTHLRIERGLGEHHLVESLAFLAHLTVAQDLRLHILFIVAHKLRLALAQHRPVA